MIFSKFSILATLAAPAMVAAAPVGGDLALVQQHLQGVQTMTAAFSQTDRSGKVVTGTLTLKKPGKIRFQYEKGVPILVVGDGKALTFIDYSVKQVQRWPIGNSPLGVLLDPTKDMSRVAKVVPGLDPQIVSVEAADPKHPEYGRITLIFVRDLGGSRRSDAARVGHARFPEQPHDDQAVEPALQRGRQRRNVPVERSAEQFRPQVVPLFIVATGLRP